MFTNINQTEFAALAALGYNRIPLVLETFADLDTPLSIYLKLANKPYSFLLESVIGGERFGRYSIIGLPAREWIQISGSIHRRFWQSPQGVASRWQIEASEITRI